MSNNFIQFKTVVPKQGELETYINKPFLDRISNDPFDSYNSKAIGMITEAIEVEAGYELTISLFGEYRFEWFDNKELSAISFDLKR